MSDRPVVRFAHAIRPDARWTLALLLAACSSPTETNPAGGAGTPGHALPAASLEIVAPDSVLSVSRLIVNEMRLFQVRARASGGEVVPTPAQLSWTSSDSAVLAVSARGVATARGRGQAVIAVTSGELHAEASVKVIARTAIQVRPFYENGICLGCGVTRIVLVGDTIQLAAVYADVNGVTLDDEVPARWESDDPAAVHVDANGQAIALARGRDAGITATTDDGTAYHSISVSTLVAGLPATLHIAHAAPGAGPVTFSYNKGAPVTLSGAGESVALPITSGFLVTQASGALSGDPASVTTTVFSAGIREGDRLSLYVIDGFCCTELLVRPFDLVPAWDRPTDVAADSVRVRLLQGSTDPGALVVYVLPPDAPVGGIPQECYFDPGGMWRYAQRPTGDFDFVLSGKGGTGPFVRIRATPNGGHSVTYVIAGHAPGPLSILSFDGP